MKKILFNTDSLILGGAEKIALDYVNILSQSHEVVLLINEDNGIDKNILFDQIPSNVTIEYVIDKNIITNLNILREKKQKNILYKIPYNFYLNKRRKIYKKNIKKIIKKYNYDYFFDFYCKIPNEIIDERVITFLHSSLIGTKEKTKKILYEKFSKVGKIVVITDDLKKEAINMFPTFINKIYRIYNFFDSKKIQILANSDYLLTNEEKKLINEEYILCCSRIDKKKDLETLIKAYNSIKNIIKENLYIVGDGPHKKNIEALVKELNLENRVIFLGNQKNPYIWMKNSKLFVHSSKQEGFGMVLVEALIFGKRVIASNCPVGPKEILGNGKFGVLFEVGDYIQLSKEIEKGLLSSNEFEERAKKRAKDFSLENIKLEIINLLK